MSRERRREARLGRCTEALRERFQPEMLNRFDGVVLFDPLTRENLNQIADQQIHKVARRVEEAQGFRLQVSNRLRDQIAKSGFSPRHGAREVRRLVERRIGDAVADATERIEVARQDAPPRPRIGREDHRSARPRP